MTRFTAQHLAPHLKEALDSLRASMPADAVSRADRQSHINSIYVGTARDLELKTAFDTLIESAAATFGGAPSKRQLVFIIGESGSGKMTAIRKHIADRKEFSQRVVDGETIIPMVSFDAPKPLTIKLLARTGLEAIGYPIVGDMQENRMWELFKQQLRQRRVMFLHIDEMQHVIRGNTHSAIQNIADIMKSLVQIPDWPLHVIFSGVPTLAKFLDHEEQLRNRSMIIRFHTLQYPNDVALLRTVIQRIVLHDASLQLNGADSDEVIHRLIRATSGAFGTIIQFVRATVEAIIRNGGTNVAPENFAKTYALFSGCNPSQNLFSAANWMDIDPANALTEMVAKYEEKENKTNFARSRGK